MALKIELLVDLEISGTKIVLAADYASAESEGNLETNSEFIFSGHTVDLNLKLSDALDDLFGKMGVTLPPDLIPLFLQEIVLKDLYVSYSTATKDINFIAQVDIEGIKVRIIFQFSPRPQQDDRYVFGILADITSSDWEKLSSSIGDKLNGIEIKDAGFIYASHSGMFKLPELITENSETKISTGIESELIQGFNFPLKIKGTKLEIGTSEADGFISKLVPTVKAENKFSHDDGGGASKKMLSINNGLLEIHTKIHLPLGPIDINALYILLGYKDSEIILGLAIDLEASLSVVELFVEKFGLLTKITTNKNAAGISDLFNFKVGFKPPNGIGINIDTDAVKGGGYLYINQEEGRYAGVAGLSIKDKIQLAAFGLINTKLPSGKKGYSFIIFISAEFTPIQLSFGFTLNGVGGIVGIHRTIVVDKLREGVKTGAYDRLLFPANPVEDALEIIADLQAIFPVEEGRYTFGIMAKIGWGTPTIITIELGVIIEVPNPVRLVILGVIKAVLPTEEASVLKLQVNFLGVIDFGKKQLSFDASLFDSKLLTFTLAGDMALRLSWGSNANFLLSVGGFHPSYQPPPALVSMKRLTINLLAGDNPRLTFTSYFAVTSNSVQFGAKAELYVRVSNNITADGYMSFDALFQFNPFYMRLLVAAYMAVKWKGKEQFSVTISASLEGPTPWSVDGTAEIKICGIKAKVSVQKTWGESKNTNLATVSVSGKLTQALKELKNWEALLPAATQQVVKLLEIPGDAKILHPAGQLRISQKVLPLNLQIQLFGNHEVSDGKKYELEYVKIGATPITYDYVKEDFTPAHFRKMSETQKLSSPSFVKYDGGVQLSGMDSLSGSVVVQKDIQYETIIFDPLPSQPPPGKMDEDPDVLTAMVKGGAAGKSGLSFSPSIAPLAPHSITVLEEEYGVVDINTLQLHDAAALRPSFAEAVDHYAQIVQDTPSKKSRLKIIPKFEIR